MMETEKYQNIISLYEELRKEKVLFPTRYHECYFFINHEGPPSPMIELMKKGFAYDEPDKDLALIKLKVSGTQFKEEVTDSGVEDSKVEFLL